MSAGKLLLFGEAGLSWGLLSLFSKDEMFSASTSNMARFSFRVAVLRRPVNTDGSSSIIVEWGGEIPGDQVAGQECSSDSSDAEYQTSCKYKEPGG